MKSNSISNADEFYLHSKHWKLELTALRKLVMSFNFKEEFKWSTPCYTINNKNIVMISTLKESCVLSFLNGSLINDNANILLKPGENSRHSRIIKFTSLNQINHAIPHINDFIKQAIEISDTEKKVEKFESDELMIPDELNEKMEKDVTFKRAFNVLSLGRKRGYCIYFSAPKQSKTKRERIEKYTKRIMDGKGLHDCVCGLSKKMPQCDGSHKLK